MLSSRELILLEDCIGRLQSLNLRMSSNPVKRILRTLAKIPEHALNQFRAHNLFTYPPFPSGHVWPDGVRIVVDDGTFEEIIDCRPGSIIVHGTDPSVVLYSRDGELWLIDSIDGCGGFLPGDFSNCWSSLEEACEDVLDFFAAGSIRLRAKESRKLCREGGDTKAVVSEEAIERLRENGIVEVFRDTLQNGLIATDFALQGKAGDDAEPVVLHVYAWQPHGWCVDGRTEWIADQGSLLRGEFFHAWPTLEEGIDDLIDFFGRSRIRKRAWLEGKRISKTVFGAS